MNSLAIIGASGHGKVVAEIATITGWDIIHFYDDNPKNDYPWEIKGSLNDLLQKKFSYDGFFIAIGNNEIRKQIFKMLEDNNYALPSLIHPKAIISPSAIIDNGNLIVAGAIINANTTIGKGCIINTNTSIDHDCHIGEFSHIAPGTTLAGNIIIGKNCWVGLGSNIIQNITITDDTYIGAGSLIIKDINKAGVYYGQPAKLQKQR